MALRSLKNTYSRMVDDIRQSGPANNDWKDLATLKDRLDKMYKYRNNEIIDSDPRNSNDDTPGQIHNVCTQHYYKSFKDFQQKMGVDYSLSIGDIDNALDSMPYCTCNGRSMQACKCVARDAGDHCSCNVRAPIGCACVYRNGGKYGSPCAINSYNFGCSCVSRAATRDCDCNGRCSCNVVNEYTMKTYRQKLNDEGITETCRCVSRQLGDVCLCHARTVAAQPPTHRHTMGCNTKYNVPQKYCDCVQRTSSISCEYHEIHL